MAPSPRRRRRPFRRPPPLDLPPATSLPASYYERQPDPEVQQQQQPQQPQHPDQPNPWPADSRSAAATQKGTRRRANEDRVFVDPTHRVFGVCDGHGGTKASDKVAELFPLLVAGGTAFKDAFAAVDREVCALFSAPAFVGTTLTAVRVCRGKHLQVAHVGDSRAVVVDAMGRATTLTMDHSPNRPDEVKRIELAGGGVLGGRVNGVLGVSRAVGDTALKSLVISDPEEIEYALGADDQVVVVASDGLWDHVSASEVAAYLQTLPLAPGAVAVPANLPSAVNALVDLAVSRGSSDDISVVLVDIRHIS